MTIIQSLKEIYYRLVSESDVSVNRYLYDTFELKKNRLIGLVGVRGTGKTTLLLQYIKNHKDLIHKAFYASADHLHFKKIGLYELVEELYMSENRTLFFIDEIHKYAGWDQELKNIYDSFPKVAVVFSGSSTIDLIKGTYDLSRRGILYRLHGLSFREYLHFKTGQKLPCFSYDEIIANPMDISTEISTVTMIHGHFRNYLQNGFYPFVFEGEDVFYQKLIHSIEKTIYQDIASFYNLQTKNLQLFKNMVVYLATISPGEVNVANLSKSLRVDNKTTSHYLSILTEVGLAQGIRIKKSGSALIRNPEKIFLQNTNLYYAVNIELGMEPPVGTVRECFFVNTCRAAGLTVNYSKDLGDYLIKDTVFEIGGRNKTRKQIKHISDSFIVQDSVTIPSPGVIPLHLFGFLY